MTHRMTKIAVLFLILVLSANTFSQPNTAFQFKENTFIKDWLLLGPFPNCLGCSTVNFKHGKHCVGFYTDYLKSIGGEKNAVPKEGMIVDVPQYNLERKWFSYHSATDKIPLNDILSPNDLVVAYAFRQIDSPKQQKVVLAVGSNDGVKVFLNGEKVHEVHPVNGRWLQKDNDYVPVVLKKGLNNLLLKIDEGAGDFGFVVRFLNYDSTLAEIRKNIDKHKQLSLVPQGDSLVCRFGQPYRISVLNPNGKVHVRAIHEKAGTIFDIKVAPGEDFIISLKNMPKGFLTVRAEFPTPEDGVVVSEMRYYNGLLKRHPRVAMLNENGFPLLEDTPFFPIGTYGAPVEDYGVLKKAGYNFVVAGVNDLDKVQQAGLKAAVPVHGSKEDGFKTVRETIAKYRNHPAVLCWMLYDEPAYNRADLLDIYKLYNIAYQSDSVHPSYLVITTPTAYTTYGRCCDILSVDTYPVTNGIITEVGKNIAKACRESDEDQPVWHCGQMFQWPAQRRPTVQEHRFMTWLALMDGAKGLLWYTFKGFGQYLPQDDPVLWKAQKQLLLQVKELAPLFMTKGFGKDIQTVDKNDSIRAVLKTCSLGTFILAANLSKTSSFSAKFKAKTNGKIQVFHEDRELAVAGDSFSDRFEPLAVHIYKLP